MRLADALLEPLLGPLVPWLYRDSVIWTVLGLAGAALFSSPDPIRTRLIQWLHSEKARQLVVPPIFWHLSFWGSVLQLLYALHIDKLPVMLSYAFLPFLYARNLWLLKRTATR